MPGPLPPLCILYGSATGNSEHIAKDLSTTIPSSGSFYSSVICCEMNQFKRKCQKAWDSDKYDQKHPVICVTSTTGNGDAPENAGRFVRYIKKKDTVASMPFQNCVYAVLALGDTNYDQFCATGKVRYERYGEFIDYMFIVISCFIANVLNINIFILSFKYILLLSIQTKPNKLS